MGFVLADKQGWLSSTASPYADTVVLNTFEDLRNAVNSAEADFFMWEHFTSKRYYDKGEIRKVGEIYTPWSSWKIVASTKCISAAEEGDRLADLFATLDKGIRYFDENPEEAVRYISTELDYSEEDAREWLNTVRFPMQTKGVELDVVKKTVDVLRKAGVLAEGTGMECDEMVAEKR